MEIAPGIATDHQYSAKVTENGNMRPYRNFHEKVETYARIISHGAMALYPEATPTPFNAIPHPDEDGSPFRYPDTASSRAGITAMASMFLGHTVAIIGLGGTGSYILDLVAKTPVQSILLFDADVFLQHNAFRSPGAAAFDQIVKKESKVNYLHRIYSEIHKGIIPNATRITEENLSLLDTANFVFIAIDSSQQKSSIFSHLKARNIPFIDVGMGVTLDDGKLSGQIRTTTGAPGFYSHLDDFVPMTSNPEANDYNTNIQIVELNVLNASLAVLRWKKLLGFYALSGEEYHSLFRIRDSAHLREEVIEE
jgi:molybdopterin/thiamine biosynthesis adenylyltransferase